MWNIENAIELYGVELWGSGYFSYNKTGNLIVRPTKKDAQKIDIKNVIEKLSTKKINFPILFRFPQIIERQIKELNDSFSNSISEYKYNNTYQVAFPMKVNQRREVIEEIVKAGKKFNIGLEVGTKAELLAAMSFELGPHAPLICNGFKDDDYIKLALNAARLKNNVIIVIDEFGETIRLLELAKKVGVKPIIGIRSKLYSKGSGKWAESGGENSKFGLTTTEMLNCIKIIHDYDMIEQLQMLHFHIGSQITEIRRIQKAVKEAARVYAKIKKKHMNIKYFNIGGGLGVDYDGSKTSSDASANYTMQEYANNVVYSLKDVCDEENVPHPIILSESGRAISAYHALLLINIKGNKNDHYNITATEPNENEPHIIKELYWGLKDINIKNYIEFYHDALQHREELLLLFNIGEIELEDKSKGEILFMQICEKAAGFARATGNKSDDFDDLNKLLSKKYIGNFSIFQSIPDFWAIKQLFPVVPVIRANEKPTKYCTIVDITCDSDGELDKFVDLKDVKELLELHELNNGYYLAILLVGAYQDTIGDYHNLFGSVNEVHVLVDESGELHIKQIVKGDRNCDMLKVAKYNYENLLASLESEISQAIRDNKLSKIYADEIVNNYKYVMEQYTYMNL